MEERKRSLPLVEELRQPALDSLVKVFPTAMRLDGDSMAQDRHPVDAALAIINFVDDLPTEVGEYLKVSGKQVTLTHWGIGFTDTYIGCSEKGKLGVYKKVNPYSLLDEVSFGLRINEEAIVGAWNNKVYFGRAAVRRLSECTRSEVIRKIIRSI